MEIEDVDFDGLVQYLDAIVIDRDPKNLNKNKWMLPWHIQIFLFKGNYTDDPTLTARDGKLIDKVVDTLETLGQAKKWY